MIVDIPASILVPDPRSRGWSIAAAILVVGLVSVGGLVSALIGNSDVPPYLWLALGVGCPALILGVQSARHRSLAAEAEAHSGRVTVLFADAALSTEVRSDGALMRGNKLGAGWLSPADDGIEVWQHPSAGRPHTTLHRASVAGVECVRLGAGVVGHPMLRFRLVSGQVWDAVPCVPGLRGLFGVSAHRLAVALRPIEAALRDGVG